MEREVARRKQEIIELDEHRASLMQVLETHGALAEYNRLQALRQEAQNKLAEVGWRIKQLKELDQGRSQLKIDLETLRQKTQQDLEDRSSSKENAISLFNANSEALYDAPGNLIIEVGKNGYHFEVEIQRTGATGIPEHESLLLRPYFDPTLDRETQIIPACCCTTAQCSMVWTNDRKLRHGHERNRIGEAWIPIHLHGEHR